MIASCEERAGNLDAAESHAMEALSVSNEVANRGLRARAWELLASIAAARGNGKQAATLLAVAAATRNDAQRPASRLEWADAARAEQRARALLGNADYEAAFAAATAGGATGRETRAVTKTG